MAIDAVISEVKEDRNTGDLILELVSRGDSIAGQPRLRIKNPTYCPLPGQFIWGGSDTCRTVDNIPGSKAQEYRRDGSGRLHEIPDKIKPGFNVPDLY